MYNHPCSIWVRESLDNYEWLYDLAHELNKEYGFRYTGKSHKRCMRLSQTYPTSPYQGVDLHSLYKLCQTSANRIIQSKRTETSITKTKLPLQTGQDEELQTGGDLKKPGLEKE